VARAQVSSSSLPLVSHAPRLTRIHSATVAEAEQLLDTKYHVYEHATGAKHVGCDSYKVPEHVSSRLELVTPSVHFDRKLVGRGAPSKPAATHIGQPGAGGAYPVSAGNCDVHITPNCLRALYGYIYPVQLAAAKNSYAVVEYTPQSYKQSDLDMFYKNFSSSLVGTSPKLVSIDGGALVNESSFGINGESDLDIQYAQALIGKGLQLTLYQVGDDVEGASFNNLLDALDGSYCTFEGGDDPTQDGVYPDPYGTAADGAYQGPEACGTVKPAYVISTSYEYSEADLTPFYATRQCAEYAKLGLMGTTVLFSSGDQGVAANGYCLDANGTQSETGKRFSPQFPASCPYVTAVGATQVPAGRKVTDPESATYEVIYSGGGFSNYFPTPAYQTGAVKGFLKNHPPPYAKGTYNASGRGIPDISANGANYVVAVDGEFELVFGTSASSPVIGALITSINDARLAIGKKPLGFLNTALYSAGFQGAYNDITNGTNPGCGTVGFNATTGWDPVTGLGTPRFPVLLAKFLLLP
jgi:tripeptidyl-peptidase-1